MECLTAGYTKRYYFADFPLCVIVTCTKYLISEWSVQVDKDTDVYVHMENPKALKPQLTVTVDDFRRLAFGPEIQFNSVYGQVYVEFAWYGTTHPMHWGLHTCDQESKRMWTYLYPQQGDIIRMEIDLRNKMLIFYYQNEINGVKLGNEINCVKLEKVQWIFGCGQFEKIKILDYGFALEHKTLRNFISRKLIQKK